MTSIMHPVRLIGALCAVATSAASFAGAPVTYKLAPGSEFFEGCFDPCHCAVVWMSPLAGTFRLEAVTLTPTLDVYSMTDVMWTTPAIGFNVTGLGQLTIITEFVVTEQLEADLAIETGPEQHYDSGVIVGSSFPDIDIVISRNQMNCYDTVITLQAEPVFGDITGDAVVAVDDLLAVINAWGECAAPGDCEADVSPAFSGDDIVDVSDLLFVINHWQ